MVFLARLAVVVPVAAELAAEDLLVVMQPEVPRTLEVVAVDANHLHSVAV
jgi:hypothetical protein